MLPIPDLGWREVALEAGRDTLKVLSSLVTWPLETHCIYIP